MPIYSPNTLNTLDTLPITATVYLVGGAVRDSLLGLAIGDRDYVVVGSTASAMLQAGFKPVGKDFPVFLHPKTHEEYALARTERKMGPGYTGFTVHASASVTLEQDLARRDLTINAIAKTHDGRLIDPYHGQRDLTAKIFRHVSPAFSEDPLRILRIARFAARYSDFTIAPETLTLMRSMVDTGEVSHLVAERVWQELSRGLLEAKPHRMFDALDACGALAVLLPELKALQGVPQPAEHHPEIDCYSHIILVLQQAVQLSNSLSVRFAALMHDLGKALTPHRELPRHRGHEGASLPLIEALCQRLRVPLECRNLALLVAAEHGNIHRSNALDAEAMVRLLMRCDALRQTSRFEAALIACQADAQGRLGFENKPYPQAARLSKALVAAKSVQGGLVIDQLKDQVMQASGMVFTPKPEQIAKAIHTARMHAVAEVL
jgi:tRNA nucleotidyltransferase (CCA-adding enzyme)